MKLKSKLLLALLATSSAAFAQTAPDGTVPVIVRFKNAPGQAEKDAVEQNGGKVSKTFSIVNAAAAESNV